jgi:hypothetical protein
MKRVQIADVEKERIQTLKLISDLSFPAERHPAARSIKRLSIQEML